MPPADPRTRDERYDDTRECNAPRAGRKAVCIFHAGAAPAVIENIYMLFMGHTCFKNQTRHRAIPVDSLSPRPTFARANPLLFYLFSFDCLPFSVPCGTTYSVAAPSHSSSIRSRGATPRTCRQRLENSTKRFTPLLLLPFPSRRRNNEYSYGLNF